MTMMTGCASKQDETENPFSLELTVVCIMVDAFQNRPCAPVYIQRQRDTCRDVFIAGTVNDLPMITGYVVKLTSAQMWVFIRTTAHMGASRGRLPLCR